MRDRSQGSQIVVLLNSRLESDYKEKEYLTAGVVAQRVQV